MRNLFFLIIVCLWLVPYSGISQEFTPNYDEAKIPAYELPDPLITSSGEKVTTASQWENHRRAEILKIFEEQMFGAVPPMDVEVSWQVEEKSGSVLEAKAICKEVTGTFSANGATARMQILIYLPKNTEGPVPVFLGLNFYGNHSIVPDPVITLSDQWMRNNEDFGVKNNRASEASRGVRHSRWPVDLILAKGFGLATIYYGDIDPDFDDGFANGVHPLAYKKEGEKPSPEQWGSIAAWAWGLSRALDYFETDPGIDHEKIAVIGHSRLGKAALWAGASDERFAMVISNDSGCGGAALSRRRIGETVWRINNSFPHWFCDNFNQYGNNEDALPMDQHMLISLIAPRPVYVASATEDQWADPKGEFLGLLHAAPVYELLGAGPVNLGEFPRPNAPADGIMRYHLRTGKHDIRAWDWIQYLEFADTYFK